MRQGTRRLIGGAAIALAGTLSVFGVRGFGGQAPERAPQFRELGPADAQVTIAEFSDFECPVCRRAEVPLKRILSLYKGQVRLIFKQFPLPARIHPWARQAALDAECVGKLGKFWPFHDLLYEHQDEWVEAKSPQADLLGYAKQVGVDESAMKSCLSDPATAAAVDADVAEAGRRWVTGTPTFFINGKRFIGQFQLTTRGVPWIDEILKGGHGPAKTP